MHIAHIICAAREAQLEGVPLLRHNQGMSWLVPVTIMFVFLLGIVLFDRWQRFVFAKRQAAEERMLLGDFSPTVSDSREDSVQTPLDDSPK